MIRSREAEEFFHLLTLTTYHRTLITANSFIKEFKEGSVLCRESDRCEYLPVVLKGNIRVFKTGENGREVTLYHIQDNSSCILTASGILRNSLFPATAEVSAFSKVLLVPRKIVLSLYGESDSFRDFILSLYSDRIADIITLVEDLLFHRMDTRIAEHIIKNIPGNGSVLRTTHQKIADEVGTSREVASRILKDMERQGIICLSRGELSIVDFKKLHKTAGSAFL